MIVRTVFGRRTVVREAVSTRRARRVLATLGLALAAPAFAQLASTELRMTPVRPGDRGDRHARADEGKLKETLERRIKEMTAGEGKVEWKSPEEIRAVLPVEKPSEALVKMFTRPGHLEVRQLDDVYTSVNPSARYMIDVMTIQDLRRDESSLRFRDRRTQRPIPAREFLSHCPLVVDGTDLVAGSAHVVRSTTVLAVRVQFNERASKRIERLVRQPGRLLGIVLDDEVVGINATVQQVKIRGKKEDRHKERKREKDATGGGPTSSEAQGGKEPGDGKEASGGKEQTVETLDIMGGFRTPEEATLLAGLLNAGSIPFPLRVTAHGTVPN